MVTAGDLWRWRAYADGDDTLLPGETERDVIEALLNAMDESEPPMPVDVKLREIEEALEAAERDANDVSDAIELAVVELRRVRDGHES